jgi:pyruvate dehydrogenase (quinone)
MNVSDFIVKRLAEWGVERVFGYPGDAISGVVGAFRRNDGRIRFIQARHEEAAAFMACGHSKFTGTVGVCMSTSGPGALHLLNGLYDARMDHVAVVAIIGQAPRDIIEGDHRQGVDLPSLFRDVARDCVQTITTPETAGQALDRAFRIAQAERTVCCVIVPSDVQELDAAEPRHAHDGVGPPHPLVMPNAYDLNRAADVLNAGQRVAILVGAGAAGAAEQVVIAANLLGAGIAKALLGRAVVPDDLPFVTGAVGMVGTRPSANLLEECDTLFVIGSSFPYPEFLPREGRVRGVQIDIDAKLVGARFPMEVQLVGDARVTLDALIPKLEPKGDKSWREQIAAWRRDWNDLMRERSALAAVPINPQRVFTELSPRLPDRAILTADAGSCVHWFARDLTLRHGMMASLSGSLGAMGTAVPYAIAAKFAHPRRPVVAFAGDGAMQMNGNAELLTIAKHFREWPDPRLIVAVLRNDRLASGTWQMRAIARGEADPAPYELPRFAYASYAELVGLRGIHVDDPQNLGPAWERALSADRPVVLEIVTDPDVLPLPPHVSLDRARAFSLALPVDDRSTRGLFRRTVSQMFPRIGDRLGR